VGHGVHTNDNYAGYHSRRTKSASEQKAGIYAIYSGRAAGGQDERIDGAEKHAERLDAADRQGLKLKLKSETAMLIG